MSKNIKKLLNILFEVRNYLKSKSVPLVNPGREVTFKICGNVIAARVKFIGKI